MSATNVAKLDTTTTLKVAALKTFVVYCAGSKKLLLRSVRDTSTFVVCCWITIQKLLFANVRSE